MGGCGKKDQNKSKSKKPACCMQRNNEPTETWSPKAESSLIENETFPEMSILDDTDEKSKTKRSDFPNLSPIPSEPKLEQPKKVDETGTKQKGKVREQDVSVIYSPLPPPRGTYGHTKSFSESSAGKTTTTSVYDKSARDYTDVGAWKNFNIPSNIEPRNMTAGLATRTRTRVPRPSRNYSTYDDSQAIFDVQQVADFRKKMPRHFSTPQGPGSIPWQGADESTIWGQDLSSFDPTNSTGWSQGVRMDSFNVRKYMTPSPKNVMVPPRLNNSYAAYEPTLIPSPGRAYKSQLPLTGPHYSYMAQNYPASPDQFGATYAQCPPSANFTQRPQSARGSTTFTRPNVTQDVYSSRLNATIEAPQRPQTANATIGGYQSQSPVLYDFNSSALSDFYRQGSKTPSGLQKTANMNVMNRPCHAACKNKKAIHNNMPMTPGLELAPLNEFSSIEKNFDTLLEIRAPRLLGQNQSNSPLQLSINVTCAERSLLVTPQQRYSMLDKALCPSADNGNCCQCP